MVTTALANALQKATLQVLDAQENPSKYTPDQIKEFRDILDVLCDQVKTENRLSQGKRPLPNPLPQMAFAVIMPEPDCNVAVQSNRTSYQYDDYGGTVVFDGEFAVVANNSPSSKVGAIAARLWAPTSGTCVLQENITLEGAQSVFKLSVSGTNQNAKVMAAKVG